MQNEPRIPRRCSIFPGRAPHPPRPSRRWGAVAALVALAAVLGIATPEDARAQALPGPPQNFTATAGDTQVVLTWDAPADAGGAAITAYQYRTAVGATVPESHSWIQLDGADSLEATVPGLTNGTQYAFEVRALNSEHRGRGPRGHGDGHTGGGCHTDLGRTGGGAGAVLHGHDHLLGGRGRLHA